MEKQKDKSLIRNQVDADMWKKWKLTQAQGDIEAISEQSGIDRRIISRALSQTRKARPATIEAIAKYFEEKERDIAA